MSEEVKWVAMDKDGNEIIAQGDNFDEVYSDAVEKGEQNPLMTFVPEEGCALFY